MAGCRRKSQTGGFAVTHYELRDHPDDLPIICPDLATARQRARRRAARIGSLVLIYSMDPTHGERFIEAVA